MSGLVKKKSPTPGFDPRTVQPVANRYTDWVILDKFTSILAPFDFVFFDYRFYAQPS